MHIFTSNLRLKKTLNRPQIIQEDEPDKRKQIIIGSNNKKGEQTIYICPNARKKEHKCMFALCGECYALSGNEESNKMQGGKRTGKRNMVRKRKRECDSGITMECCEHGTVELEPLNDKKDFTEKYIQAKQKEKSFYPLRECDRCKSIFTDGKK